MHSDSLISLLNYIESKKDYIESMSGAVEAVDAYKKDNGSQNKCGISQKDYQELVRKEVIEDREKHKQGVSLAEIGRQRGITGGQIAKRFKKYPQEIT